MFKYFWLGAFALIVFFASEAPAVTNPTYTKAIQALQTEAATTSSFQKWNDKKEDLSSKLRNMKMLDDWLTFQTIKYKKYLKKQQETIMELKRRKAEIQKIRMELEPFLETIVQRLEEQINKDIPFLKKERSQRIAFLKDSLDDYHLDLSEKLRLVFEALQIETEYGRTIETTSETININNTPTTVALFRLGRTALYYQTEDGKSSGFWDRSSKRWIPLGAEFSRDIQKARDMASRKRAVEILSLPISQSAQ